MFCSSLDESKQLLEKRDGINIKELSQNANTNPKRNHTNPMDMIHLWAQKTTALDGLHSATVITAYFIIISRLFQVTQVKCGKEPDRGIWIVSQSSWSSKPSEI